MPLPRPAIGALLRALIAEELGVQRGRAVPHADSLAWCDTMTVDEEENGLGVDSLARLAVVARVNTFFHLHEVGSEDYLLVRRRLSDWTDVVAQTLAHRHERITFQTSGTSGAPKAITHAIADLHQEAAAIAQLMPPAGRIIAYVPPHHIYGFIWTVLLAEHWDIETWDARSWGVSRLTREARANDLIIATPFIWNQLARTPGGLRGVARGVSSGGPLAAELFRQLQDSPLQDIMEVYGSTETAGVGWRRDADAPFTLMPHWRRSGTDDTIIRTNTDGEEASATLQDHLDWRDDRHFLPAGRRDGVVQVAGVNVCPDAVRTALLKCPGVADAALRLSAGADARLKAFIVPKDHAPDSDDDALRARLVDHCAQHLSAPERPGAFTFGPALPRNAMGKRADW